jgi:hypothetical protein
MSRVPQADEKAELVKVVAVVPAYPEWETDMLKVAFSG